MSRFLRFFRVFAFVIACAFSAFSAQAYTITLDDQGAIDHSVPQSFDSSNYQVDSTALTRMPYRPGYGYGGHWTGPNCSGSQKIGVNYPIRAVINGSFDHDQTLYACWKPAYSVGQQGGNVQNAGPWTPKSVLLFDTNGGTGGVGLGRYVYGWHELFGVWFNDGCIVPVNNISYYFENRGDWVVRVRGGPNGNADWWAVFSNDGYGNGGNLVYCTLDATAFGVEGTSPTRQHFLFDGYTSNSDGTGYLVVRPYGEQPNFPWALHKAEYVRLDLDQNSTLWPGAFSDNVFNTVYAKWRPDVYQVNLATGGNYGTGAVPNPVYLRYGEGWYDTREHAEAGGNTGKLTNLTTGPSYGDLEFGGYYIGQNGDGIQVVDENRSFKYDSDALTSVTRDSQMIYPRWDIPSVWYTLTLNDDNGNEASSNPNVLYYSPYCADGYRRTQDCSEGTVKYITKPQKTDYVYAGHYLNGVRYISRDGEIVGLALTGDVTVNAVWYVEYFDIEYLSGWDDEIDGNGPSSPMQCRTGGDCIAPDCANDSSLCWKWPSGRLFRGWGCTMQGDLRNIVPCKKAFYQAGDSLSDAVSVDGVGNVSKIMLAAVWESDNVEYYNRLNLYDSYNSSEPSQWIFAGKNAGWFREENAQTKITTDPANIFAPISQGGGGLQKPTSPEGKIFKGYYVGSCSGHKVIDYNGDILSHHNEFAVYEGDVYSLFACFGSPQSVELDLNCGSGGCFQFQDCSFPINCPNTIDVMPGQPLPQIDCVPVQQNDVLGSSIFLGYSDREKEGTMYYLSNNNIVWANPDISEWPTSGAPTKLYAIWQRPTRGVTYYCDIQDESGFKDSAYYRCPSYDVYYGGRPQLCPNSPASNTSAGKKFEHWYIRGNSNVVYYGGQSYEWAYDESQDLIAAYSSIYRVSLDDGEDVINVPAPDYVYFSNGAWYENGSASVPIVSMLPKPVKIGYNLNGYYTSNGIMVVDGNGNFVGVSPNTITQNNYTVTAQWSPVIYTITLNRGDGSGGASKMYYRIDKGWDTGSGFANAPLSSIAIPNAPSGTNKIFGGYYTEPNGQGTPVIDGQGTILYTGTGAGSDAMNLISGLSDMTFYAKWDDMPSAPSNAFTITTTSLAAGETFRFTLAAGGNFYIDWGDGTVDNIVRNWYTPLQYVHTYTSAAPNGKTIKIWGNADGYAPYSSGHSAIRFSQGTNAYDSNNTPLLIAGISGSLGAVFPTVEDTGMYPSTMPTFYATFSGCSNLTTDISTLGTLFSWVENGVRHGVTGAPVGGFDKTFENTGITGNIPVALFAGVSGAANGMFHETFKGCTGIESIPAGLFSGVSGVAIGMFAGTFEGCTGITSIPVNLFSTISATGNATGSADGMFQGTFKNTGITTLPATLFGPITASGVSKTFMMSEMFANTPLGVNTNYYIPKTLFISNNQPIISDTNSGDTLMTDMFNGTNLITDCSIVGLTHYQTNFDDYWDGKKICAPAAVFSCVNPSVGGTPTGTIDTIWADQITSSTTLPAATNCTAPTHYTKPSTAYWACTGNSNCTGNPNHWAAGGSKPSWLTSSLTQSVNFYMEYTPNEYNVSLNANGGTAGSVTKLYEKYNTGWGTTAGGPYNVTSLTPTQQLPTRQNYSFTGYYDHPTNENNQMVNADGQIVASATVLTDNTKIWYAHWQTGPYTVTFRCDVGGNLITSYNSVQYGDSINVPAASSCIKNGYTFSNWKIVINDGLIANTATTYVWNHYFGSDVVPDWQPVETTITLDPNFGESGTYNETASYEGSLSQIYGRYSFGAYRDVDRTEEMTTGDHPLPSLPMKYVDITFDLNDGNSGAAVLPVGGTNYTNSNRYSLPVGLLFWGYYSPDNLLMINGAVKFDSSFTIVSNPNRGYITSVGMIKAAQSSVNQIWTAHWSGKTITDEDFMYQNVTLSGLVPQWDGYVFDGWYTSDGDRITYENGDFFEGAPRAISANTTWVAHWTGCSHNFGSNPHAGKTAIAAVDGMCGYHITCDVPVNGYSQHGGSDTTGAFDFYISPSSTDNLPGCLPRVYNIGYDKVFEYGGTMPDGAPQQYTYGTVTQINVAPISNSEVFEAWCVDEDLSSCVTVSQAQQQGYYYQIGNNVYGPKVYYAKWSDECQPGYTRYDFETTTPLVYTGSGGESTGGGDTDVPAQTCVPIRYHVNCRKNCDGDTCAACLEDFYMSCAPYGGSAPAHWHLGGGYNVQDFYVGATEYFTNFDGGFAPVKANPSHLWTTLPDDVLAKLGQVESGYDWCALGAVWDVFASMYVGGAYFSDNGNYKYFIESVAQNGSNPDTSFGRAHYTFDGLWTASDGGIQYIDGDGNFANGNSQGYNYLPWPNAFHNHDVAARQFQNFFFDNGITPSATSPYTFDVYAHWIPDVYTITLNANGATTAGSVTKIREQWNTPSEGWAKNDGNFVSATNFSMAGSGELPSKFGYTFTGYWTDNVCDGTTGTRIINADGTLNTSAATSTYGSVSDAKYFGVNGGTLYACWTSQEYEITLKPNLGTGAHGTGSDTTIYTKYATGVYTNSARTDQYRMTPNPNGENPVTLPERYFTIIYNPNYAGGSTWNSNVLSTFNGYYRLASGGSQSFIDNTGYITPTGDSNAKGYTNNKDWYAQWTNGSHDLHLATRDGYVFKGWYNDAQLTDFFGYWTVTITPTADKTLYAKWAQCNWTAGANSTAAIQPMDNQHYPNRCKYHVTCTAGYKYNGDSQFDYYGDAGVENGTLPGCDAQRWNITYHDSMMGYNGVVMTGISPTTYSYDPNNETPLGTPSSEVAAEHHATFVHWCDASGMDCTTTLGAGVTGDQDLYAVWSCDTGYMTYGYDTWVGYLYTGTGGFQTLGPFAAGTCAPIRYHVKCDKNCPAGETCNACLEDFNLNSANYHFGGGYDVQDFEVSTNEFWELPLGGYVPVRYLNGFTYGYGGRVAFAQNYPAIALGFAAEACEVGNLAGCMYNESDAGNYKTFLMNISDFSENNGLDFGADHYDFDGLYAQKNGVDIPYIDADGNFANGNSQGYNYLPWPIDYTDTAGAQAAHAFQNFFFDNEIPVSSSPFPDAPYTFDVVAHWTPKVYTITLCPENGTPCNTGSMSGQKKLQQKWNTGWKITPSQSDFVRAPVFNNTNPLQNYLPIRDGFDFVGYYTAQNCGGTKIINADGTLNMGVSGISDATYFDDDTTLYACWESMTYDIYYSWNGGNHETCDNNTNVCPSFAVFGDPAFRVPVPTHSHGTFKGWKINNMQSGVTHYYGPDSSVQNSTEGASLDLSQTEDGASMNYFKDLRKNHVKSVRFIANWECEPGFSGSDCSVPGEYTVTIKAGYGVGEVSADDWDNNETDMITKTFNVTDQINLTDITANLKTGYIGRAYRLESGSAGNINGNTFTVGAGNATIYIDATGITAPSVTISDGATKVYNHLSVPLYANNSVSYDDSISLSYQFAVSDTEDGTYTDVTSDGNAYLVQSNIYHGTKYYKVKVTATGEGSLTSSVATSATPAEVTFKNAPVTFNANGGTLLDGTAPLEVKYVPYGVNGNLYSTANSETTDMPVNVPTPERDNYTFTGWYTTASDGGTQIYDVSGNLTMAAVFGYVIDGKWVVTNPTDGVILYARWTPNIYTVTLNQANPTTAGSVTVIREKWNTPSEGWDKNDGNFVSAMDFSMADSGERPSKTGYSFGGYYTEQNCGGAQIVLPNGNLKRTASSSTGNIAQAKYFSANATLYACWMANTYQIQYNLNNGQTRDNTSVNYNQTTGPIANPTAVNEPNGTYHQESFAGWNVTNMQSGITHFYGATSSNLTNGGTGTDWNYNTITPSIKYFKNLRADTDTVLFEAVWNCVYPYQGAACDTDGGVMVTVNAGNGIASVNGGTGWTGNGTGTITRTVAVGTQIDLSNFATAKAGYTGRAYVKTSDAGTLSDSIFTVGAGDAVITINATGIEAPSVTLSPAAINQIYNYQPVTLAATVTRSDGSEYAQGITFAYEFAGPAESSSGSWNYVPSANNGTSNTKGIDKDAFLGTRFYKARVTASGEGNISSDSAESNTARIILNQKQLAFEPNGGTLGSTSGRYIRYDSDKLYAGATNNSEINVPGATKTGYDFDGWFTDAEGGDKIYNLDLTLADDDVDGWIGNGVWKSIVARKVYAHWVPKTFVITLNRNGVTNGTAKFYEKYGEGYALTGSATDWRLTQITVPTKVGYDFAGYYDTEDFSGTMVIGTDGNLPMTDGVTDPTYFTQDATLYAKWTKKSYTVVYNCNGNGAGNTQAAEYDTNFTVRTLAQANCNTSVPGATFGGWTVTPAGGTRQPGDLFLWQYTANQTFTAIWTNNTYTLTYSCGTGTGTPPASWTGNYHAPITVSGVGNCAKVGHSFTGWAVTPAGGTQQPGEIAGGWPYLADQTFTAQWTADTYDISYDENGGTRTESANAYPLHYTYGVETNVTGGAVRAHSTFQGWCSIESSDGTLSDCQAMPFIISTNETGDKTLHAKWTCEAGYTESSDKQSCLGEMITLDWQENNGDYADLANGQCTYGGNLTLPGMPPYDASHVFNGWETYGNSGIFAANTQITGGCVETYTGVTSGTSTHISAHWCNACNPTNASCILDATTQLGTCTYTTSCNDGYHLSPDSQLNVYNTVCIPYTITYQSDGHGSGAIEDVLYNSAFTTNNATDSSQFNWDNHIVTEWTTVSGGSFPDLDTEYPYNVQSDTVLKANWGECHCTLGDYVASCETISLNNACEVSEVVCESGHSGGTGSCVGVDCTSWCDESYTHTIRLKPSPGIGGTKVLYAIDANGGLDAGVYLDAEHQQRMTENDNHITLPTPVTRTVTYDKNANDAVLVGNASVQVSATFNGYYNSITGTDEYIAETGYITSEGITEGTEATDHTWYAQWTNATVILPYVYRPGYKFLGWFTATGTVPVGQCGDTYSVSASPTLYAHWQQCEDGEYCPGVETVNGSTVYNVVKYCPGEYVHSVLPRAKVSDCYLNLTGGEWVETAGQGTVDCTQNYYCDEGSDNEHPASPIFYSDETNDGRRITGGRKSCTTDAGNTFKYTESPGANSINQCYKIVTLDKRGGSGGIQNYDGTMESGTNSATQHCFYQRNCVFSDASGLILTGHTFHGGWIDQADTDCTGTTHEFVVPNDTDTYYACRTTNSYTVTLKDGLNTNTVFGTIEPTYGAAMPSVDSNGNPLTVPTKTGVDNTTYTFEGYYSAPQNGTAATQYYDEGLNSVHVWSTEGNGTLYARWSVACAPGYYLPANATSCTTLCPAGRYCAGNETFTSFVVPSSSLNNGLSGYIAAGYYSTGGASVSTPTGHVTTGDGCYGQVNGADTACGLVAGGYYSTGRGTSATPTEEGNGCLTGKTCGKVHKNYFSNGGGKVLKPSTTGCVMGQFCGICPLKYRSSTTTGKASITECTAACVNGTQVETAEDPTVNNADADGCTTPDDNNWWSNAHTVAYGSASPTVTDVNENGVHACATNYNTSDDSSNVTDHDERKDCTRTVNLMKNGGTTVDGAQWPDNVIDVKPAYAKATCQEGEICAFGNPAELLAQTGYTFQNMWGTDLSCANPVVSPITTLVGGRYYACKSQNNYTLTYACGDGATGDAPSQQTGIHYNDSVLVSGKGDCNKRGHSFTGWVVSGTEDTITATTWPHDITWNYEESKTFTAQWTADTYDIMYDENGGSRGLPTGYTLMEYVDANADAYINTSVAYDSTKEIIVNIVAKSDSTPSSNNMLALGFGNNTGQWFGVSSGGKWTIGNGGISDITAANKTSDIQIRWNGGTEYLSINGASIGNRNAIDTSEKLQLFGRSGSGTFNGKIYFAQVIVDGTVVHNFVPAQNGNDVGMYDTITKTFFTNAATSGSFTAGETVIENTDAYPKRYTYGVGANVYGVPTRAHSVFEGWCAVETPNGSLRQCSLPYVISTGTIDDIELHARWTCEAGYTESSDKQSCIANEFTLVYNKNGHGTQDTPANQTCAYGDEIVLADSLSDTGWWFYGWVIAGHRFGGGQSIICNEEYLGVTGGATTTTVNVTADWSAACNEITLNKNSNGASWPSGSITTLYAKTRESGSTTDGKWYKDNGCTTEYTSADYAKVIPTRLGWAFRGFYADSNNATDINATQTNGANRVITHTGEPTSITGQNFINGLNAPATLYAGWAKDCAGVNGTCVRTLGTNTSYTTSCATGYHYGTAPNGVTYNPATNGNTSESTYYPICVPNTITIILDKNGGTGTCGGQSGTVSGTLTCDYDGICNTPVWSAGTCALSKTRKIFAGWNTTADGTGTQYGTATVAGDVQNINDGTTTTTLYAVWKDIACNVTNGTATEAVTGGVQANGNTPVCAVMCESGYESSGRVIGQQHEWVVDTDRCNRGIYDINYELYGGNRVEPNGYTLLQYVTADGNQYIDTEIAIKKSYEIRSKFEPTSSSKFLYGIRSATTDDTASATAYIGGVWRWGKRYKTPTVSLDTIHTSVQNVNNVVVDGVVTAYEAQSANFETPETMLLGTCRNYDGISPSKFVGNIYEFRILDGDRNDLMNLVPARHNSDGKVGFYDVVSGEFFTSDSGTEFEAGPEIYTLLDYIQSDGTSYINLGFKANSAMRIETEFKRDTMENDAPFGVYGYGGNLAFYTGAENANSYFYGANKIDLGVELNTTNWHSVVVDGTNGEIVVDGESTPYSPSAFTQTANMVLFARRHNSSGYGMYMNGKIRYFRVYDNGVLYFNGVPAKNNSGVVGIYDTVSGRFFMGANTYAFSGGTEFGSAYPEHYVFGVGTNVYGVPVRANSVFEGWCRNLALTDGCTMIPHVIGTTEYGPKNLYAKWSCVNGYYLDGNNQCVGNTITINYQNGGHGGTPNPLQHTCVYGATRNLAGAMGAVGYVFGGWNLNGEVYDEEESISCNYDTLGVYSGNVTAVAVWDSQQYTVTYDCNTSWTPNNVPTSQNAQTDGLITVKRNTCVNPGYRFVKWAVSGTDPQEYKDEFEQFTWRYTENKTFSAVWEIDDTDAFTVTVDMPANKAFEFTTIATGQFWVDWDDGSNIEEYAPTTITTKTWTHTYTTAGTYVIKIGGRATGYAIITDGTPEKKSAISFFNGTLSSSTGVDATVTTDGTEQYITAVSGKLGDIFPTITAGSYGGQPRFYRTFKNTTNMDITLQSVADLFDGVNGTPVPYMFAETFDGSAVTGAIPAGLFPVSGAVKDSLFLSTFRNCTGLTGTIPANLFVNINGAPKQYMFSRTFRGCTGLAGIPAGLFKNISGAPAKSMYSHTFHDCSNIVGTLSSDLFGSLNGPTKQYMFYGTFEGCTKLTGDMSSSTVAIPNGLFGTVGTSTTDETHTFYHTFYGCSALNGTIGGALFGGLTGAPAEHMFDGTFYGCSNLTGSIPQNLFGNMTGAPRKYMFESTFDGCSGLTGEIPSRLFGRITGTPATHMFYRTFWHCSGLTGNIPNNLFENISGTPATSMFTNTFNGCNALSGFGGALFSGISGQPATGMFTGTFANCSGLTGEIPTGMFGSIDGTPATSMFYATFSGCSGLTGTIPSRLFGTLRGEPAEQMFKTTFNGCAGLTGYVPEGLFGTMAVTPEKEDMMLNIFVNTGLLTTCPCGTVEVPSDFRPYWNSTPSSSSVKKISCKVGLKPGEHWYNGVCTTECSDTAIDRLHVGNLDPYIVLADKVSTVAVNIKNNDTICYVPLARGGSDNNLNVKYGNPIFHLDRPNDTPPAGFGQR